MSEILLQAIIEKLEKIELLLKQVNSSKDAEIVKALLGEIKKLSILSMSIDKIDELKLSVDRCSKILEHPPKNQIIYKHYLHKGTWIAVILFFVAAFFLSEWISSLNDKKKFEASDIK